MSQEEILVLLKKHKKMTSDEIIETLQISRSPIYYALSQLLKYNEIKRIYIKKKPYYQINNCRY